MGGFYSGTALRDVEPAALEAHRPRHLRRLGRPAELLEDERTSAGSLKARRRRYRNWPVPGSPGREFEDWLVQTPRAILRFSPLARRETEAVRAAMRETVRSIEAW